jgi:hypothetical protein
MFSYDFTLFYNYSEGFPATHKNPREKVMQGNPTPCGNNR